MFKEYKLQVLFPKDAPSELILKQNNGITGSISGSHETTNNKKTGPKKTGQIYYYGDIQGKYLKCRELSIIPNLSLFLATSKVFGGSNKKKMKYQLYVNREIPFEAFISVYERSGINRPINDQARMRAMMDNANLIVSAWNDEEIIGLARCFIDYGWVCYLSDLLVDSKYQNSGIGKLLIDKVRDECGKNCQLVLLSAPGATEYYPKVGFEKANHAFYIKREQT